LLAQNPRASLREVARGAGISPTTARDVRRRLEYGERPASRQRVRRNSAAALDTTPQPARVRSAAPPVSVAVEKLLRDPSLRHNEQGRRLLRALQVNAIGPEEWAGLAAAVPSHCTSVVVQVARQYAQMWLRLARDLDDRMQIMEPFNQPVKE
jgi:hypothetical protein